jgi:allantoin racemase
MMKKILLIAPFVQDGYDSVSHLEGLIPHGVEVSGCSIEFGPPAVESAVESGLAIPGTVAKIIEAEKNGIDAIVINCMTDTAVDEGRACVSIPVLGPFESGLHLALQLGPRVSIITMIDEVIPDLNSRIEQAGMKDRLASIYSIEMPCAEMLANPDERNRRLTEYARVAVEDDGADVILLGCTEMAGSGGPVRSGILDAKIDVPVIDPIPAAIHVAAMMLGLGISHSKFGYPGPEEITFIGHDFP